MMVSGVKDYELRRQEVTDQTLDFDTVVEMIEEFPRQVKWAIEHAPEDRLVDVLATIHSTQTNIQKQKLRASSEVTTGEHGDVWKAKRGRKGMRSFNTMGLLATIHDQMDYSADNMLATLMHLLGAKVITIKWSWSALEGLMQMHNLDLRRARHEIEDGDPDFDYGEYWEDTGVSYVPVEGADR